MIKRFTLVLIFLFSFTANAQIILTQDTTVCGMQTLTLSAISSGVDSLLIDDIYSDIIDITFPFSFYGNTYDKMLISSNLFNTYLATAVFPLPVLPYNNRLDGLDSCKIGDKI